MSHRGKTLAFYVEALVLTLVLLVSAGVLLRVFAAAAALGHDAQEKNAAALLAQNVTAAFAAGTPPLDSPGTVSLPYAADGTAQPDGPYRVTVTIATAETAAPGTLLRAELTVACEDNPAVYTTTTERYLPAG